MVKRLGKSKVVGSTSDHFYVASEQGKRERVGGEGHSLIRLLREKEGVGG